jgi:hypothetical protein
MMIAHFDMRAGVGCAASRRTVRSIGDAAGRRGDGGRDDGAGDCGDDGGCSGRDGCGGDACGGCGRTSAPGAFANGV